MRLSEFENEIEELLISSITLINGFDPKSKHQLSKNSILELAKRLNIDLISYMNKISLNENKDYNPEYEEQLIKLEQDIRNHIKTEFQLKIYSETIENRLDLLERENDYLKKEVEDKINQISELEEVSIKYQLNLRKSKFTKRILLN